MAHHWYILMNASSSAFHSKLYFFKNWKYINFSCSCYESGPAVSTAIHDLITWEQIGCLVAKSQHHAAWLVISTFWSPLQSHTQVKVASTSVIVILRSKQYKSVTSGFKEQITTPQSTRSSSSEPNALQHHPSPWSVLDTPQPDLSQELAPKLDLPITMSASVFWLEVDNTELRSCCSAHQKRVLSCIFLNCSDTITWQFNQTEIL